MLNHLLVEEDSRTSILQNISPRHFARSAHTSVKVPEGKVQLKSGNHMLCEKMVFLELA